MFLPRHSPSCNFSNLSRVAQKLFCCGFFGWRVPLPSPTALSSPFFHSSGSELVDTTARNMQLLQWKEWFSLKGWENKLYKKRYQGERKKAEILTGPATLSAISPKAATSSSKCYIAIISTMRGHDGLSLLILAAMLNHPIQKQWFPLRKITRTGLRWSGDQYNRIVEERKTQTNQRNPEKPMQTFQTRENKTVIFPRKSSPWKHIYL